MWHQIYESAWLMPGAFWAAQACFVLLLAVRGGRNRPFFAAFTIILALDAWLNGALSPLGGVSAGVRTAVAVLFVLLGDGRYFLLLERALRGRFERSGILLALATTLLVPVAVGPLGWRLGVPERFMWLSYELGFCVLAIVMVTIVLPRRRGSALAYELTLFQFVQYGLWALADIVLWLGHDVDAGWALRLVPNVLYYALFLPFAWWRQR